MKKSSGQAWAEFRLKVIGNLLAAPPAARGDLKESIGYLAERFWSHPLTGKPTRFGVSTLERWYYKARKAKCDTTEALMRKRRRDATGARLSPVLVDILSAQYRSHPSWSAKLHSDNLSSHCRLNKLEDAPSYQTIRRFLGTNGMPRLKKRRGLKRAGEMAAEMQRESREVRSYEMSNVGGMWHLDFHHAKRPVLTREGTWATPLLLAIIDDHSRLICHLQWYLTEATKDLVHGFSQALMRRGLPRKLMTDNGPAMVSAEFTEGLTRLGINHDTTLPYSPYQNGKMECFWGQVEGRLMAMLENRQDLDLDELNRLTHVWVEMDYHHQIHSETVQTPLERALKSPSVLRPSISSDQIRLAFRAEQERMQRRSDGTIMVDGVRFEIPSRFRHLTKIRIRYARWDLSDVSLVSADTGQTLCALYPLNKARNASGQRRSHVPQSTESTTALEDDNKLPPYLAELVARFEDTGLKPPFISTT